MTVEVLCISHPGQEEGRNEKGQCFGPCHWLDDCHAGTLVVRQINTIDYLDSAPVIEAGKENRL